METKGAVQDGRFTGAIGTHGKRLATIETNATQAMQLFDVGILVFSSVCTW